MEDYIAPRFSHKRKSKLRQKILEAHANVKVRYGDHLYAIMIENIMMLLSRILRFKDLNLIEAKMNFIKAWQSLPEFGISLFVVKFHGG